VVLLEGRAGFDEVDDEVRETDERGELDRALDKDDLGLHAARGEVIGGDARVLGRHARHARHLRTISGRGDHHAAAPDTEVERLVQVVAALEQDVAPGDAEVGGAELDIGGDVVRLQEQKAHLAVGRLPDEAAVVAVEHGRIEPAAGE
jgi:hypothetical protein